MNQFNRANNKAVPSKVSLTGESRVENIAGNRLGDGAEIRFGNRAEESPIASLLTSNRMKNSSIASSLISNRMGHSPVISPLISNRKNMIAGEGISNELSFLRGNRMEGITSNIGNLRFDLPDIPQPQEEPSRLLLGNEKVIVQSHLPILHLLEMRMNHQLSQHATFSMKVEIIPEAQSFFLNSFFQGQEIQIFENHETEEPTLLFCGRIQSATGERQNQHLYATIDGISYSVELDEWERYRSFQNINLTYWNVLEEVTGETRARFIWGVEKDKSISKPFIQYGESNWNFIKRLASYFQRPIQANAYTNQPDFYFGVRQGELKTFKEKDILEFGLSDKYFESGGYEVGLLREHYRYLRVKHREHWQLGDTAVFGQQRLTVIDHQVQFEKGELIYIDTLGAEGFLYQKRIPHHRMTGVNLGGWIRRVEHESVYVQFDFDREEKADYPWPWTPEVGNLCYIMPEVNSRVGLMFPTDEEQEGTATHLLRLNSGSPVFEHVENKQFFTKDQKIAGLFPEQVVISGKDGDTRITLEDKNGITLNTVHSINLRAQGEIQLIGNKVSVVAPKQVSMQTPQSNIIMAKNFNLFAPSGVITKSSAPPPPARHTSKIAKENHNHWPLSYAVIGALPKNNPKRMEQGAFLRLGAKSAMPKIARPASIAAMSQVLKGRKAEQTSAPKAFASFGNHTMKGGFLAPLKHNLSSSNRKQGIASALIKGAVSMPAIGLIQTSQVIGRIGQEISNLKSLKQFNRMSDSLDLKSRTVDIGIRDLKSRFGDNVAGNRKTEVSLGENGIMKNKARLKNVNTNGLSREGNQGVSEIIASSEKKSRL